MYNRNKNNLTAEFNVLLMYIINIKIKIKLIKGIVSILCIVYNLISLY